MEVQTVKDYRTSKELWHKHSDDSLYPVAVIGWNKELERVYCCLDCPKTEKPQVLSRGDLEPPCLTPK